VTRGVNPSGGTDRDERVDHPAGDGGIEQAVAGGDGASGREKVLRGGVLEEKTRRARSQSLEDVLVEMNNPVQDSTESSVDAT
jgi:hypothetical protein